MNELVSIVIPVYNVEDYLSISIESVISQTYPNIEIILIDDGSSDSSGKICDDYSKTDNRITVIHKENEGVSAARNTGILIAKGEYLVFLDADDKMTEVCIERMMQGNKFPLVVGGYKKFGAEDGLYGPNSSLSINIENELMSLWGDNPETYWWYVWGKLFKREIIINNRIEFRSGMIYLEDFCFVLEYLKCIETVCLQESYELLHLIEKTRYSKFRMDYNNLRMHMEIHEECFSLLEKKCQTSFVKMRQMTAFRHFSNFINYLIKSDASIFEKYQNMVMYKNDYTKPELFKYIVLRGKRIKIYWSLCNIIYYLFYFVYKHN